MAIFLCWTLFSRCFAFIHFVHAAFQCWHWPWISHFCWVGLMRRLTTGLLYKTAFSLLSKRHQIKIEIENTCMRCHTITTLPLFIFIYCSSVFSSSLFVGCINCTRLKRRRVRFRLRSSIAADMRLCPMRETCFAYQVSWKVLIFMPRIFSLFVNFFFTCACLLYLSF